MTENRTNLPFLIEWFYINKQFFSRSPTNRWKTTKHNNNNKNDADDAEENASKNDRKISVPGYLW